jgi:hypothetical protein
MPIYLWNFGLPNQDGVKKMTKSLGIAYQSQGKFFCFSISFIILMAYSNISLGILVAISLVKVG